MDQMFVGCKYCGKTYRGYAISKIKEHLTGINAQICPLVTDDVKTLIAQTIRRKKIRHDVDINSTSSHLVNQTPRGFCKETSSNAATDLMKSYRLSDLTTSQLDNLKARHPVDYSSILKDVKKTVADVRLRGDTAVIHYSNTLDKVEIVNVVELVEELPNPELDETVRASFDMAYDNIHSFHAGLKPTDRMVPNIEGVACKQIVRSISAVGLYVPGGSAVQPSTVLMLAVPAKIAGCETIVLATTPSSDGSIRKEIVYCAKKAGVTHILKAGGAQAIAAMAWGTSSCPKVHKICGPGNKHVTAAKMILQNSEAMVAIDMLSGPSDMLVIIDESASPVHVAADLLSQTEHGSDSHLILVIVGDRIDANAINEELIKQCKSLPTTEIALKAISQGFILFVSNMYEALEFSNAYAPEHLIVNVHNAEQWEGYILNAGSVFLGGWTPKSVGEHGCGTNQVVPTCGYAHMFSGISVDSFSKYIAVQCLTDEGLATVGPNLATMAEVEELVAHKRAVSVRLDDIKDIPAISMGE